MHPQIFVLWTLWRWRTAWEGSIKVQVQSAGVAFVAVKTTASRGTPKLAAGGFDGVEA